MILFYSPLSEHSEVGWLAFKNLRWFSSGLYFMPAMTRFLPDGGSPLAIQSWFEMTLISDFASTCWAVGCLPEMPWGIRQLNFLHFSPFSVINHLREGTSSCLNQCFCRTVCTSSLTYHPFIIAFEISFFKYSPDPVKTSSTSSSKLGVSVESFPVLS